MNSIILFSAILAIASSQIVGNVNVVQDTAGAYNINLNSPTASRHEQRLPSGKTLGSYNFVDDKGLTHTITYVASEEFGFQASGAGIPVPPRDISVPVRETPEVLQARYQHLALVEKERALNPAVVQQEFAAPVNAVLGQLNVPEFQRLPSSFVPSENPENVAATAEHLRAHSEAISRLAEQYRRTSQF